MQVAVSSVTDVGRVRQSNEDSYFANGKAGLFVVCDGMGGHSAGEVASRICCDTIVQQGGRIEAARETYSRSASPEHLQAIQSALAAVMQLACAEIFRQATKESGQAGMGTTCTAVLLAGHNKAVMAHVGDSRLYLARGGHVHRLSEDHTFVAELVRRNLITKEQARNHPQGNVLTRAMGVQASVSIDTLVFDIDENDTFMLCSDGVYNYFQDDEEFAAILADGVEDAAKQVVHLALERGGHDNCTAIVFRTQALRSPDFDKIVNAEQRIVAALKTPLFAHLNYNEAARVVGMAQVTHLPADTTFLREGQPGHEFFIIVSGEVQISRAGKVITTLQAGAPLGEMAMVDNAPRSATARTIGDTSLLVMRREEFFTMIRSEPTIASKVLWNFIKVLSSRVRSSNEAKADGASAEARPPQVSDFEIFIKS